MALVKSSALARTQPRAAVWMASTAAAVHTMVVAGCFGDQGCLWVAVSYLGVLAGITAEYDYDWAVAYDLVIRSNEDRDPSFKAADALPFYRELHQPTMLDLKMRPKAPAHWSGISRQAPAEYAEQYAEQ